MGCGIQKSVLNVDHKFKVEKKVPKYTQGPKRKHFIKLHRGLEPITEVSSELELSKT